MLALTIFYETILNNTELFLLQIIFSYNSQKVRANIDKTIRLELQKDKVWNKGTKKNNYYLNGLKLEVTKN